MRSLFVSTSALALLCGTMAQADPAIMLGGSVRFGAGKQPEFGISGRILSNNQADEAALGAGVSYYPGSGSFGADAFVGWVFDHGVIGVGYDFSSRSPIASLGWVDVENDKTLPPPPAPPPPPPPPPP